MKERPILFSAPMVKAILAGAKTQTRRAVKPQPPAHMSDTCDCNVCKLGRPKYRFYDSRPEKDKPVLRVCPFGVPGDRLWVRETFFCNSLDYPDATDHAKQNLVYRADDPDPDFEGESVKDAGGWCPSIHMPKWASRITLEVCSVRVERLQSISREDALAEGISVLPLQSADDPSAWYQSAPGECQARTPVLSYGKLWESIYGEGSWALSPWVWRIEFRRIDQQ